MKHEKYLLSGEWHIHTNYTDGKNSVNEYCKRAARLGLPLIAFTEHVRKVLTYNFHDLVKEIEKSKESYPELTILTGCEAKVLENGDIDVSSDVIQECDIVLMAFHSFPDDKAKYLNALMKALTNPIVDIWAHPGLLPSCKGNQLTDEEVTEVLNLARDNEVLIEINRKYHLPPARWFQIGRKHEMKFVRGSDIHSVREMI